LIAIVGWVSSFFERNPTKNVGLRSKNELTQPTEGFTILMGLPQNWRGIYKTHFHQTTIVSFTQYFATATFFIFALF